MSNQLPFSQRRFGLVEPAQSGDMQTPLTGILLPTEVTLCIGRYGCPAALALVPA